MATFIGLSDFDEIGMPHNSPTVSTKTTHQEILRRTGKKHPRVLYIPTARLDSERYIDFFRSYYLELGCSEVDTLCLLKNPPSKQEIADKIFSADAIYVNGGNTFRMLRTWERLGVDTLLQRAHKQGTVIVGHSAGTVCWFAYACSDSFYKKHPFKLAGMGVFNAVLCPHYDSETVRQPALKKIMKRTPRLVAVALDDAAAIEIIDDSYRILTATPTAKARRMYWKRDQYVVEEIPSSNEFRDLKELLTKPGQ
jgi:peptidase E